MQLKFINYDYQLLLKKKISPTLHSSNVKFWNKNNPPCNHVVPSFLIITWNCKKPLIALSHPNTLNAILKNWDYCAWLCWYGSHGTIKTIHVTKKLSVQTKRLEVLVCYNFHFKIFNDKKDVMVAIKLDLFSIGTIIILINTEPIPKPICIPNIVIAEQILK